MNLSEALEFCAVHSAEATVVRWKPSIPNGEMFSTKSWSSEGAVYCSKSFNIEPDVQE